jgi:DNA polymerase I
LVGKVVEITLEQALQMPKDVGFDFETTGLNWWKDKPLSLGLGTSETHGYIDLRKYEKYSLILFFRDFFNFHRPILQNAKFDFHVLSNWLSIDEISKIEFADTMLISQIVDENRSHGLDNMVELWMGEEYLVKKRAVDEYKKKSKLKDYSMIPFEMVAERGEEDAVNTSSLYSILRPRLFESQVYLLEKKLVRVLLRIEHNGALMDRDHLLRVQAQLKQRIEEIAARHPGVDLASSKQTADYLFGTLKIEAKAFTDKKKQPKTDVDSISLLNHPAAKDTIEFRNLSHTDATYVSGFLDKIDDNNLLHCNFKQMGARTGRMSCANPNLQQLPKDGADGEMVKTAFIGDITTYDYSQMEAILYAFMNHEEGMIAAVKRKEDLYKYLAKTLYNKNEINKSERSLCKGLFLGRIYGMGNKKFIAQSQGLDPEKTREFFGRLSDKQRQITDQVEGRGYVETILGRKRHLAPDDAYKGLNSVIQGSAADIVKQVMINLPLELQNKLMIQVHDELVFRNLTKEEQIEAERIMIDFKDYDLSVGFGTGSNWWKAFLNKEAKEGK